MHITCHILVTGKILHYIYDIKLHCKQDKEEELDGGTWRVTDKEG